jgi:hypothetical protein
MATQIRFHHRPFPRTQYLLGRPASVWIDALSPATHTGSTESEHDDARMD